MSILRIGALEIFSPTFYVFVMIVKVLVMDTRPAIFGARSGHATRQCPAILLGVITAVGSAHPNESVSDAIPAVAPS
jgi:hypothetical protein